MSGDALRRDRRRPIYTELVPARVDGEEGHRLMIVLAAPGCTYWHETGGCTNCAFPVSMTVDGPVTAADYDAQMDVAVRGRVLEQALQVDLFVSGSFFNAQEVPLDAQVRLIARAAALPGARRVLVETRPEYVDAARLKAAVSAAGACTLDVAIGLESADATIRDERINKGFHWRRFAMAASDLAAVGAAMTVYVLLKPMDTDEREAIEDAVSTCQKVLALGRELALPTTIALEPCFVPEGTKLYAAFQEGRYRPPWLWSVVEVVGRVAPLGTVHVGLSEEGLGVGQTAHNCDACSPRVRAALVAFNRSGDPAALDGLDCSCRAYWRSARS